MIGKGMTEKDDVVRRLTACLETAAELRVKALVSAETAVARKALRSWQAGRLARTHADFLASAEYADAARFFLNDIYGTTELANRDIVLRKVAPIMTKTLPVSGLEAIADAIELDALSEDFDAAMVASLGDDILRIDAAAYGRAYRAVGRREDRRRQIDLIDHLGASLERLTQQRFIGAALAAMRKPADIAGFGELQKFLERGYGAFRKMKSVAPFLGAIVARERVVSEALFAGDDAVLDAGTAALPPKEPSHG
jgi:hypothetical protein